MGQISDGNGHVSCYTGPSTNKFLVNFSKSFKYLDPLLRNDLPYPDFAWALHENNGTGFLFFLKYSSSDIFKLD